MINDSSDKEIIHDGEVPSDPDEWGTIYTSEFKRPISKLTFELKFAPRWNWEEVKTAHFTRNATYTLVDEEGDDYSGRVQQYSAPKEPGTSLRHITITLIPDPED